MHDHAGAAVRVARAHGVASTADGRYALRIGDESKPVVGDDITRLLNDRPARPWESLPVAGLVRSALDADKCAAFAAAVRALGRPTACAYLPSTPQARHSQCGRRRPG